MILTGINGLCLLLHRESGFDYDRSFGMKISFWVIGKTNEKYLETGIQMYTKRLMNYIKFELTEFRDIKNFAGPDDLKKKEAEMILQKLKDEDFFIVLDEGGKHLSSTEFAGFIEKNRDTNVKNMIFLVGGAYGVHETVKNRANLLLSFSKMTFSHQMIRLFFTEQLYRAMTIIKNEKYHNP